MMALDNLSCGDTRFTGAFISVWQSFKEKLSDMSSSGAVFFAVCRGKVWGFLSLMDA